jgi:DNA-binding IclR family transcriptional regulator
VSESNGGYFVSRTVEALEVLSVAPSSAAQLARALQIHPRTARRMLARLVEEGYVVKRDERRGRYELTMHLVAVAGQALARATLPQAAAPLIGLLHDNTGLSAHVVVPSYDSVLCVAHRDRGSGETSSWPRELIPCHCTAGGKVLLANRDRWRQSVLRRPLAAPTDRTTIEPRRLATELVGVRERGYATEHGEYRPGMHAVAAPVRTDSGAVIAAVTVCSTEYFDVGSTATEVIRVAAAISARSTGIDDRMPLEPTG